MTKWLLLFMLITAPIQAATYWVTPTGTGANGCVNSATQPSGSTGNYQSTFQAAFDCVGTSAGQGAGDTVYVMNGTYNQHLDMNSGASVPSGTAGSYFTFSAAPGNTNVVIQRSGPFNGWLWGDRFININGFIFDGTNNTDGHWVLGTGDTQAAFVNLTNNEFRNTRCLNTLLVQGSFGVATHDITLNNNLFHGGEFGQGNTDPFFEHVVPGCAPAVLGGNTPVGVAYPIYMDAPGSNIIITHNEFYDFPRIGIQFFDGNGWGGPQNFTFAFNTFHHFGSFNRDPGSAYTRGTSTDIGGLAVTVFNQLGDVGGKVYGNLIYAGNEGIQINNVRNTLFYNNTIYGMVDHPNQNENVDGAGITLAPPATNTVLRNNLLINNAVNMNDLGSTNTSRSNNLCSTSGGTTNCDLTTSSSSIFVDAGGDDFRLQSGSPAVNVGADLGSPYNFDIAGVFRPQGAGWDIGAYEFASMAVLPTVNIAMPISGCTTTSTSPKACTTSNATLTITGTSSLP